MPDGFVALEVGYDQAEAVASFAKEELGYGKVESYKRPGRY